MSNGPVINPREVPVVQVDHHLPAVLSERMTPAGLRRAWQQPPIWTPEVRAEPRFTDRIPQDAAVLIGVVTGEKPTVLLTQRTAHLSTHSGQIAFPGGKIDKGDTDAVAAALREAQEEVALDPSYVDVLGTMPVYTTGSAFRVTPVVALIQPGYELRPNPDEVAHAFEVPLAHLMDPANHRHHEMLWDGQTRRWFSMPYLDGLQEHFIWGATAGMLRNLYRLLSA